MGLVDELVAAVQAGPADEGKKAVAVEFLKGAGPVVEALGTEAFNDAMASLGAGNAAPEVVVRNLNAEQVAALLGATEAKMAELAEKHVQVLAAREAAMEALRAAALSVLARVVVGVL